MAKTYMVLFPLENNRNARKQCELIENMKFSVDSETELNEEIIKVINDDTYDLSTIEVWELTDFMDLVNDGEFKTDKYFISYVHTK